MTTVLLGDCVEVMRRLGEAGLQVDSIVTDPPYHLESIVKRFGAKNAAPAKFGKDGAFGRVSKGFQGQEWDGGDVAADPETWKQALAVLKPGGYLIAFSSSRTYHRMVMAIEMAGFIIHPMIGWIFGQGFPKAHKVDNSDWEGWYYSTQSLKPALEPVCMAQKPMSEKTGTLNVLKHGTGAININAGRIPLTQDDPLQEGISGRDGRAIDTGDTEGAWGFKAVDRPAGLGRWPANLAHDGSEEVIAAFPYAPGQQGIVKGTEASTPATNVYGKYKRVASAAPRGDMGSAARFFYSAKASKKDRAGSSHPTVKPIALMRWLVRMVTPPGGLVLDPFAGSGSTLQAALEEGFRALGIEKEEPYVQDIVRRLSS